MERKDRGQIFLSRNLEHILFENMKPDPTKITFDIYNTRVFRVTEARITIHLNMIPEVL
jgi:hypothetical protein